MLLFLFSFLCLAISPQNPPCDQKWSPDLMVDQFHFLCVRVQGDIEGGHGLKSLGFAIISQKPRKDWLLPKRHLTWLSSMAPRLGPRCYLGRYVRTLHPGNRKMRQAWRGAFAVVWMGMLVLCSGLYHLEPLHSDFKLAKLSHTRARHPLCLIPVSCSSRGWDWTRCVLANSQHW